VSTMYSSVLYLLTTFQTTHKMHPWIYCSYVTFKVSLLLSEIPDEVVDEVNFVNHKT
jgi:hypothetical protein